MSQKSPVPLILNSGSLRACHTAVASAGHKFICIKFSRSATDFFIETEVWKAISSHWWVWKSPAPTLQSWKKNPEHRLKHCENAFLIPTPVAWEQLGVPEIVYGRVSVMRVVLPVSAAVWGRGGKCLSVHLQVHEFVAWAWKVRGVAAAALGANQTQDQREEADTCRNTGLRNRKATPVINTHQSW